MDGKLKRAILHYFFPNRCPECGELLDAEGYFCETCTADMNVYSGQTEIDGAAGFFAAFDYDENVKNSIYLLKSGNGAMAARAFSHYLAEVIREGIPDSADIITSVPGHRRKVRIRGYDQTRLIADALSEELGIPSDNKIIVKVKAIPEQKKLSADDRKKNVIDAYKVVSPEKVKGRTILLIDDICTTGSTLNEITSLLVRSGAERVFCAVCCKTPPPEKSSV